MNEDLKKAVLEAIEVMEFKKDCVYVLIGNENAVTMSFMDALMNGLEDKGVSAVVASATFDAVRAMEITPANLVELRKLILEDR